MSRSTRNTARNGGNHDDNRENTEAEWVVDSDAIDKTVTPVSCRRRARKNDPASESAKRVKRQAAKPEPLSPIEPNADNDNKRQLSYMVVPTNRKNDECDASSNDGKKSCIAMEFVEEYCKSHGLPVERSEEATCPELLEIERKAMEAREDFKSRRRAHDDREYSMKMAKLRSRQGYKPNPKAEKQEIRVMNNRRSASARRVYDVIFETELLNKLDEVYNHNEELVRRIEAIRKSGAEVAKERSALEVRANSCSVPTPQRNISPNSSSVESKKKCDVVPTVSVVDPQLISSKLQLQLGIPQLPDDVVFGNDDDDDWINVSRLDDVANINTFETSPVSTRNTPNRVIARITANEQDVVVNDDVNELSFLECEGGILSPLIDAQPMTLSQEVFVKEMFPSQ